MKTFMVLALAALAHARPEPPSGYNYQRPIAPAPPQVVYGQPSFNRPELSLGSSGSSFGSSQGSGSFGGSFGSSGPSFGSLGSSGSSFGSSGSSFGSSGGSLGSSGGGFGSSGGSFGSSGGSFGSGSSSFGSSSFGGSSGQSFHQQQNLAPIIQKHIYVHVPPPEPIEEQKHFINQAIAPRKNYKIIFIKAPTAPAVSQQILQQQQEIQEKTIVYVLVKKPDEQEALQLSGIAPTKPSKPEVYFIKYKTQKDHGLSGSGSGGGGAISGLDLSSGIGSSSSIGSSSIGLSGVSSSSSQSIIGSNYGPPGQSGPY